MTERARPFAQVDVFSATPYLGNPVAVVLDGEGLSDQQLQTVARWTNLSETTFVLPATTPDADYRLRIFTPSCELPFAGHPTLGSAHAWLEHGGEPASDDRVVQECQAGRVTVRREPDGSGAMVLSFAAPPTIRSGPVDDAYLDEVVAALGLPRSSVVAHQWVDNGPGWAVLQLSTAEAVLALRPDLSRIPTAMVGVIGAYPAGSDHDYEMRTFAPRAGVAEDPVCGSMNASVAQWLMRSGAVDGNYRVSQGTCVGRAGTVALRVDEAGTIWVGGATTTCISGSITV
jgi:PhzF family phenazine biosynthesis protein